MDLRMDMKKTCVKKRDWTQKLVNHSRPNSQHIWGGAYWSFKGSSTFDFKIIAQHGSSENLTDCCQNLISHSCIQEISPKFDFMANYKN